MGNSILQAIILGLVQGLGEFLPISSSGHLVVTPWVFGFSDPGLAFSVALHFGTLLAVTGYFWKDFWVILKNFFSRKSKKNEEYDKNFAWLIIIGTIPGVIVGFSFQDQAETLFRHPLLVAGTLVFGGMLLLLADKYAERNKTLKALSWKDAFIIGVAQAVAIVPGISRSGATITAGLAKGFNRVSVAKFSFFLSAPIIFGAMVLEFPDLIKGGITKEILIGTLVSALSGYLAIKYLIKLVEKGSYAVFFWYRLALASLIVVLYFLL